MALEAVAIREPFNSFGLSSREAIVLSGDMEEWLGIRLSPTLLFEYPNIEAMSRYLAGEAEVADPAATLEKSTKSGLEPIAIIGIGCRFPGAANPEAFWELLFTGVDAITEVPEDRWSLKDFYHPDPLSPGRMNTRWGGFLQHIDRFDPYFFGISPREAAAMDPQQRLLLETAYEALQDGGQVVSRLSGSKSAVFIGISTNDYGQSRLSDPGFNDLYMSTGNASSIAANRISYVFGFQGPSIALDTACSSSLMAIHLAQRSLRSGESSLALAGGVNIILSPYITMHFSKAGFLSPDGRCKTFDARADGYVRGEGAGIVLLKRLSAALRDGDPVYAVIRGSAANQDGRSNGLTAPNGQAQEEVLREAYRQAKVSPGQVQYVEAHGTGTALGDPIEAAALGRVLSTKRSPGSPCLIGSVKSNIGHLEAAAGIAGVIKVALSLKHGVIPPSLHFRTPNPHINFDELQLQVQQQPGPWPDIPGPSLAGVSSFGFGGTNVHVVMEEAPRARAVPARQKKKAAQGALLLPLSAHSKEALSVLARNFREFLEKKETTGDCDEFTYDTCFTAGTRRDFHDSRLALVGHTKEDLCRGLDAFLEGKTNVPGLSSGRKPLNRRPKLVFVFSGQGSEWPGMGRQLFEQEPVFRSVIEQCDREIRRHAEWSLIEELTAEADFRLNELDVLQPMLFSLQVALAELWRSWGLKPDALTGYSIGEIAAAHVGGALSLESAVRVICTRSRLLNQVKGRGSIAVVELSLDQAKEALAGHEDRVFIAAGSSPTITVLSGEPEALQALLNKLQNRGVYCLPKTGDVAFHTRQLEPLCSEFRQSLQGLLHQPAAIPVYSTVTGTRGPGLRFDAEYWVKNLKEPVLFSPVLQALFEDGCDTFVEISPHPIHLGSIHERLHSLRKKGIGVPSLRRRKDEREIMLSSLGTLFTLGFDVDLSPLYPVPGRRLRLPSYPWQRERCWIEAKGAKEGNLHPLLGPYFDSPAAPGMVFWKMELGVDSVPYLRHHCVRGVPVVPGAAYVEMARAAAEEIFGPGPHILEKIEFKKALFLPEEGAQKVQLAFLPKRDGSNEFRFYSFQPDAGKGQSTWTLHADGHIRTAKAGGEQNTGRTPGTIRSECPETIPGDVLYREMDERGLNYGPAFRGVVEIRRRDGEAIAAIRLPEAIAFEAGDYGVHPALLDACFQVLGAAYTEKLVEAAAGFTFLPVGLKRFRFFKHPPVDTPLSAHARLRYDVEKEKNSFEGDVFLLDGKGNVMLEACGLKLQRIDFDLPAERSEDFRDWLYELRWEQKEPGPDEQAPAEQAPGLPGSWLIFSDRRGVGAKLQALLEKNGRTCVVVSAAEKTKIGKTGWHHLDSTCPEDFQKLLTAISTPDQPRCRGVIHLWSLDSVSAEDVSVSTIEKDQELCSFSVLHLVRALAYAGWREPPRLYLVTRGVHAVESEPGDAGLSQSTLWGLGRVITLEHPEFYSTMIDLDPEESAEEVETLFRELGKQGHEDQVVLRGRNRFVARLAQIPARENSGDNSLPLHSDGTYLITGGLGGLGLTFARWLVEKGARHLVLMGRSQPSPAARKALQTMAGMGARVEVVHADVGRKQQVAAALSEIEQSMPPLRGIIHGAGLLDDAILLQTNLDSFKKVMAPKIRGTWNLHTLTVDKDLDFFVLFSSASSLIGSPGQGNYSAANAFLDTLAQVRRARGLPVLCVNWGSWAEVGLAAQAGRTDQLAARGVFSIPPRQGVQALGYLLGRNAVQVGVLPMDWLRYRQLHPADYELPLLTHLLPEGGGMPSKGRDLKEKGKLGGAILSIAKPGEQEKMVAAYLREQVAKALGITPEKLEMQRPLNTLGIDSLMAVEIKNRIEFDMNLIVSMVQFLKGPTVEQLTTALHDQLTTGEAAVNEQNKVAQLLRKKAGQSNPEFPLSYGQRAFWFLHRVSPESAAYNIFHAAHVRPQPDIAILEQAFRDMVDRHPSLRTGYCENNGSLVQQVQERPEIDFQVIDALNLGSEQFSVRLQEEADRPFDLGKGPLLRIKLFTRSAGESMLTLAVHHIAVDFRSLEIILYEVLARYNAVKPGSRLELPAPESLYRDFVRYQADMLAGPEGERLWAFWQKQLHGELPVLNLPADRPRPKIQTFRGDLHHFELKDELSKQLKELAKAEGVTLFNTFLAAFFVLLYRCTGQEDILAGTPTVGRSRPEFEKIVGYFVNPVVLRADLSRQPIFTQLLHRVRQTLLAALDHQGFPFPLLVERLQLQRDTSRSPLFQVDFVWEKSRQPGTETNRGEELEFTPFVSEQRGAAFDITFRVFEIDDSISITLQYNADLFDETTIRRLGGNYRTLLEGIAVNPRQCISELPLLTEAELRQMLLDWNDTRVDIPEDVTLTRMFENRVQAAPGSEALTFENEKLTYREMNRRSNRVAHYLRKFGAGADTLITVCMERSIEMVVGIYGIIKAGAAYVPLGPDYPKERLTFILEDTGAAILLTQQRLVDKLSAHSCEEVICLDTDRPAIDKESGDNPVHETGVEDIAYAIYTSGSTGLPKGAMNSHLAICNRLIWMQDAYGLTKEDRVMQKTPFSFDVSVWEFFWPLLYGAGLIVARPGGHQDSAYLVKLIVEQQVTTLHFVPSMLKVFLDEKGLEACTSLKRVICSGEALSSELRDRFFSRLNAELHNLYGPTESAVDVTYWGCQRQGGRSIVPIGRPIANIQIYILDAFLRPVPIGVAGELHIGGIGLARGYLNRLELTAEKFVNTKIFDNLGRLYKTGDLARFLPDGNIEYLGRLDFQVKIRGFRIELEEIEIALTRHPALREAVVIIREDLPGDRRLVGYIIPGREPGPNVSELRAFLKEKLPGYMVPAAFVTLKIMPLTANGKVDRRALPAPDGLRPELKILYAAPHSEAERTLAAIWKQVLQVEKVGMNDSFFDLGGHSLLMVQVHDKLQEIFKQDFSIMELFQYPTVSSMADFLTRGKTETAVLQHEGRVEKMKEGKDRLKQQLKRKQRAEKRGGMSK